MNAIFPPRPVRISVLLRARVRADGAACADHLRVRDLSAGGMRVVDDGWLAVGDRIGVDIGPLEDVLARVVWRRGNEVGVAFTAAIDPQVAIGRSAPPSGAVRVSFDPRLHDRTAQTGGWIRTLRDPYARAS